MSVAHEESCCTEGACDVLGGDFGEVAVGEYMGDRSVWVIVVRMNTPVDAKPKEDGAKEGVAGSSMGSGVHAHLIFLVPKGNCHVVGNCSGVWVDWVQV